MKRVAVWGFGALGRAIVGACADGRDFVVTAVIDHDDTIVGGRISDVIAGFRGDLRVSSDPGAMSGADIIFHAATSEPSEVLLHLTAAVGSDCDVVTAAEWMFYPWLRYADLAERIDREARTGGRRVVGCGVNPGFAFDTIPLVLSQVVPGLRRLDVTRVADVSGIGRSDFAHVGLGLKPDVFAERLSSGAIHGHIGFPESMAAVAERRGWPIDTIEESWEPVVAGREIRSAGGVVARGAVAGVVQRAVASVDCHPCMSMTLEMLLDPDGAGRTAQETVIAEGTQTVTMTVSPSASPVSGAATMMLHAARGLDHASPGLVSLLDLPLGGAERLTRSLRAVGSARTDAGSLRLTLAEHAHD
ncbi:MAG: hypothetical protein KDJ86_14335 [Bauldia sp.]|uniref:hypothetical protein n=1 Tax=Bauldia sp. TaxID=2575872 RepID=UPI001DEF5E36|nr:hypothetical protein [Bauldia sp.]MCB1496963.1 hypothetical protein [Bauldia sp.]